jgi:CHAT domain-containing protein
MYYSVGKSDVAVSLARYSCQLYNKGFINLIAFKTENEILAQVSTHNFLLGIYLSTALAAEVGKTVSVEETANLVLSVKGIVSDVLFELQKALMATNDSLIMAKYDVLYRLKRQVTRAFIDKTSGKQGDQHRVLDSLRGLVTSIEGDLSRLGFGLVDKRKFINIDIDTVVTYLPPQAALVEYVSFPLSNFETEWTEDNGYMAIIAEGNRKYNIINLGDAREIDSLVDEYCRHMARVTSIGGEATNNDLEEYRSISRRLYEIIWRPLRPYLQDKQMVLIAPEGELHKISLAALSDNNDMYIAENKSIHYLSSARDLIRLGKPYQEGVGLLAIGAPDYDAESSLYRLRALISRETNDTASTHSRSFSSWKCDDLSDIYLQPLPGAKEEIESVISDWDNTFDENVFMYIGSEATEGKFKDEARGKRVIHIATHGYFVECPANDEFGEIDSLYSRDTEYSHLLSSGLFLAGINQSEFEKDSSTIDDGILTAYEISDMNLEGLELVVLSACESARGEIMMGQGTHGLRWAFQKAGARSVVSSLWPVSDQPTAKILGMLYQKKEIGLAQSLRSAQLACIRNLRQKNLPDHPITWGAFISVGDWR